MWTVLQLSTSLTPELKVASCRDNQKMKVSWLQQHLARHQSVINNVMYAFGLKLTSWYPDLPILPTGEAGQERTKGKSSKKSSGKKSSGKKSSSMEDMEDKPVILSCRLLYYRGARQHTQHCRRLGCEMIMSAWSSTTRLCPGGRRHWTTKMVATMAILAISVNPAEPVFEQCVLCANGGSHDMCTMPAHCISTMDLATAYKWC
jgi:hypothetical protein